MRLVEVVMLMGAHCVSPVEHSQMMTDAAKVQCAVVIEKDTDKGTMTVTPATAASDPQVMAAVDRFRQAPADPLASGGSRIVPAWAPAGSSPVEIKPPVAKATVMPEPIAPPAEDEASLPAGDAAAATPAPAPSVPPEPAATPEPEKKVATLAPAPQKRAHARAPAAKKQPAQPKAAPSPTRASAQCKGAAVAKWYKTADGKRKYRCVKPTSDSAPEQLY